MFTEHNILLLVVGTRYYTITISTLTSRNNKRLSVLKNLIYFCRIFIERDAKSDFSDF